VIALQQASKEAYFSVVENSQREIQFFSLLLSTSAIAIPMAKESMSNGQNRGPSETYVAKAIRTLSEPLETYKIAKQNFLF
jgi:hypothetical protein